VGKVEVQKQEAQEVLVVARETGVVALLVELLLPVKDLLEEQLLLQEFLIMLAVEVVPVV
jgi:hypothetical protein